MKFLGLYSIWLTTVMLLFHFSFEAYADAEFGELTFQNPYPAGVDLSNIEALNDSVIIGIGANKTIARSSNKGQDWDVKASGDSVNLYNIEFVNDSIGWIVGQDGTILKTEDGGYNWQNQKSGSNRNLHGIHFTNADTGWVTGRSGEILRTQNGGEDWSELNSGTSEFLKGVYFVDSVRGWAIGSNGTVLYTQSGGNAWTDYSGFTSVELRGVKFINDSTGWVVGRNGIIFKTTDEGNTWQSQSSGTNSWLNEITVFNDSVGLIGGRDGVILKTSDQGGQWFNLNSGVSSDITGITVQDSIIWGVGERSLILHSSDLGNNWTKLSSDVSSETLIDVHFVDSKTGWSVGSYGKIIHTSDGETWEEQSSGTSDLLRAVDFANDTVGWTVGRNSTIKRTNDGGKNWTAQQTVVQESLWDVYFVDENNGWIVGANGTILHTTNGGDNWFAQNSGTSDNLYGVHFLNDSLGWVVGDDASVLFTNDGGDNWIDQNSGPSHRREIDVSRLKSVYILNDSVAWTAGTSYSISFDWIPGRFYTTDQGNSWTRNSSGVDADYEILESIHFDDNLQGWNVGGATTLPGIIYYSPDSGNTWQEIESPTNSFLNSVHFPDPSHGWMVGHNGTILKYSCSDLTDKVLLNYPAANQENVFLEPEFTWDSTENAETYQFQLAADDDFNTIITEVSGKHTTSFQIDTQLSHFNTYYWRVRGFNDCRSSEWTQNSFTTKAKVPGIAQLYAPEDENQFFSTDSLLQWKDDSIGHEYYLQVANDTIFENPVIDTFVTDTFFYMSNLVNENSHYFWRVNTSNNGKTNDWSETWSFQTYDPFPEKIMLISPKNKKENLGLISELAWASDSLAENYLVKLATDSNFSSSVMDTTVSDTSLTLQNYLSYDQSYYWKVRGLHQGYKGEWSEYRTFNTENKKPGNAILNHPDNEAKDVNTSTEFKWEKVKVATQYQVHVAYDSAFNDLVIDSTLMDTTMNQDSLLNENTGYFWRVRAWNGERKGDWSSARTFQTELVTPSKILLYAPGNNYETMPPDSSFIWFEDAIANNYEIIVSEDSTFMDIALEKELKDTIISTEGELENNNWYYWRVRGINDNHVGKWSETRTFKTHREAPSTISLVYPKDGADNKPADIQFEWEHVNLSTEYVLMVDDGPNFPNPIIHDSVQQNTYLSNDELENDSRYYWRVKALNKNVPGDWSLIYSFTTEESTNLTKKASERGFTLSQNAPNPFKGETKIRYTLPYSTKAKLTIFNAQGERVKVLDKGEKKKGRHEVTLNSKDFPHGLYFYQLQTNSFIDSKSMIIIKD